MKSFGSLLIFGALISTASAGGYDLASSFDPTDALSGTAVNGWTYGQDHGTGFTLMNYYSHAFGAPVDTISDGPNPGNGDPASAQINHNASGSPINWYNGIVLPNGALSTHPWSNSNTVFDWTASPGDVGTVGFTVNASMLDGGSNFVSVYDNSLLLSTGTLSGRGDSFAYSGSVSVANGDVLSIVVAVNGLNSNQMQLDSVVTPQATPEPSTTAGLSVMVMGVCLRRRVRRSRSSS